MDCDFDEKKFWSKVEIQPNGCWNWNHYLNNKGYGVSCYNGQQIYAHRLAYKLKFGEFHEWQVVCHKCDNPACINPEHLFLGLQRDNQRDAYNKGRLYKFDSTAGDNHPQKKVTSVQVTEILCLYPDFSVDYLAHLFKISVPNVRHIIKRYTWKSVPLPTKEKIAEVKLKYSSKYT